LRPYTTFQTRFVAKEPGRASCLALAHNACSHWRW
jgi:hypothetical protein